MNKAYSHYNDSEFTKIFEEACEALFDDEGVEVGDVRTLYVGEIDDQDIVSYTPDGGDLISGIAEKAHEQAGEYGEDYLNNLKPETIKELGDMVQATIKVWAIQNMLQPTFFVVENIKEIQVKLIDDSEYSIVD